jgi:hypothetical protein
MARTQSRPADSRAGSALSNGTALVLAGKRIDGRSALARRFRDVYGELRNEYATNSGGPITPSADAMLRRAAQMTTQLDLLDRDALAGEEIDIKQYASLGDALNRCLAACGFHRQLRDFKRGTGAGPRDQFKRTDSSFGGMLIDVEPESDDN